MGSAHRQPAADHARLLTNGCLVSPHCRLPAPLAMRFGGLDGIWLHYGPIGKDTTPLVVHRAERPASERNAGALDVETRRHWRRFADCHVDIFALDHRPAEAARKHVQTLGGGLHSVLWCVFSVAWCDDGRTRVSWSVPGLGLPHEGYVQFAGGERPSAATQAQFDRLLDLLDGNGPRRGRPLKGNDSGWREPTERAIARKAEHPDMPWKAIAAAVNMSERTLRKNVRMLKREAINGADGGLHLVVDGGN